MNKKPGTILNLTLIAISTLTAISISLYNSNMLSSSKVIATNNGYTQDKSQVSTGSNTPKEAIISEQPPASPSPTPDPAKILLTPAASATPAAPSTKSGSNTATKTTKAATTGTSTGTKAPRATTSPKPAVYTISGNGRSYRVTAEERNLLARLVNAEAGGESYEGKLAVATVVINRVISGTFPGTVTQVIMGKESGYYQFTPVADGRINNPPSADALKAADQVLHGYRSIPTKVMWFQNPQRSTSSWITNNKTFFKTIGNHDFYY